MAIMMPVEIGQRIGLNLALVMKREHLTQGQVAARASLSQPTVSALVSGATKDPPISTLVKISGALGITLDDLLLDVTLQDAAETEQQLVTVGEFRSLQSDVSKLNDRLAMALELLAGGVPRQIDTQAPRG